MTHVHRAENEADLLRAFPVMAELRPHLASDQFIAQVQRQQAQHGYELALLETDGQVAALAGYRISECLAWGRHLYVDDLVTASCLRDRGCGQQLLEWLLAEASRQGCGQFHLDSGVQRFAAHGFYLKNRLHITAHHFARILP
jgi:GNAT superfamily N-acetyltransferase